MQQREASAVWNGTLREGSGTMTAPGGVLQNANYTWASRFDTGPGTNPEELIAAANRIIPAVNAQLAVRHPERPEIDRVPKGKKRPDDVDDGRHADDLRRGRQLRHVETRPLLRHPQLLSSPPRAAGSEAI